MSVVVLGSANVDVTINLERVPSPGETVLTDSSGRGAGGKGSNQAIAAARAGAPTQFIGAVGTDSDGDFMLRTLSNAGVDVSLTRRVDAPTGTAYVMLERGGENAIVVVAGANGELLELTGAEQEAIAAADVLLMQLETPMPTVLQAAACAHAAGVKVVLNAAPFAQLPEQLLKDIDLLNVNEHEAALALDVAGTADSGTPEQVARALAQRVSEVLITLGADGSLYLASDGAAISTTAPRVKVIDTTGAGDTFIGAYCAAIVAGLDQVECLQFATSAAGLAVQSIGAATAIPAIGAIRAAMLPSVTFVTEP
ncbi:MAG: ribokinase [Antricoccus sp.]